MSSGSLPASVAPSAKPLLSDEVSSVDGATAQQSGADVCGKSDDPQPPVMPKIEHPGVSALKKSHMVRPEGGGAGSPGAPGANPPTPQMYSSTPGSSFNKSKRFNRTIIKRGGSHKMLNESRIAWAGGGAVADEDDDLKVCESTFYLQVGV